MIFISYKKLFSFSRYSIFRKNVQFFPSFSQFPDTIVRWNWNNYDV